MKKVFFLTLWLLNHLAHSSPAIAANDTNHPGNARLMAEIERVAENIKNAPPRCRRGIDCLRPFGVFAPRDGALTYINLPGADLTLPFAISNSGDVYGIAADLDDGIKNIRGFAYEEGVTREITHSLANHIFPIAANNNRQLAVTFDDKISGPIDGVLDLSTSVFMRLETFVSRPGRIFGINDYGHVLGAFFEPNQNGDISFIYTGSNNVEGIRAGNIKSFELEDFNNNDYVVGQNGSASFLYKSGDFKIFSLRGRPHGLNNASTVVGEDGAYGFMYKNNYLFRFAAPGGGSLAYYDINDQGQIAGVTSSGGAFIYTPEPGETFPQPELPVQTPQQTPVNTECLPLVSCAGKPVNLATGMVWHRTLDFSVPGRTPETALEFDRTYTAADAVGAGDLGPNWHHNFETSLLSLGTDLVWVDEKGGPWTFFAQEGSDSLAPPPGLAATMTRFADRIELRKAEGTLYTFSLGGQLMAKTDRYGVALSLAYDVDGKLESVSSPMAGTMHFTRNAQGRIATVVRERDNLTYTYTYGADGRLSQVKDFADHSYFYTYISDMPDTAAQGMIASITDPLNRTIHFTYYPDGKAYQQFEPEGGERTFTYGDHQTTLKEIDGYTYKYFFDANLSTIKLVLPDGTRQYTKWENGRRVGTWVDHGGTSRFSYDGNGNMNSVQRPEDTVPTQITYDPVFNKPTLIQPAVGASTEFILDEKGDVQQTTRNGLSLTYTRDSFGNILSTSNGRATYSDVRDSNGLLTTVFDSHNPEVRAYDGRARLSTRTFLSGRVLAYTYDDYDRVTAIVDSHGPTISNVYDAVGKLTQQTKTGSSVSDTSTYQYDERDRLVAVTDGVNRTTTFQYDQVHVIEKPKLVTDPAGRVTQFFYDKRQRLAKSINALGGVTAYTYDNRGNRTSVTDPSGNVIRYAYDLNDRMIREDRPSAAGSVAARRVKLYFYDGADHLVREVLLSATNGSDRAIYYQYDSLDRMVRKIVQREGSSGNVVEDDSTFTFENQLDAELTNTAVNGVASLGFTNEAAPPFGSLGFSVAASQSGNPLGLIEGSFSIARDVTGEIASVAKDGNTIFTRTFDPAGRLTGVSTPSGFSTTIGHDGFGRRNSIQHSTGENGSFQRDLIGRITQVTWTGPTPISETLSYDLAGNVTSLQRESNAYTVAYDAIDQILSSSTSGGSVNYNRSWSYDGVGNRIQASQEGAGSFINNFLVANGVSTFLADPDGFGDVVRETSGASIKNFGYRADGLLNAVQSGTTQVAHYFDALGRRAAKVFDLGGQSFSQSFVYLDRESQVLMAKAGDGTVTTYLDGQELGERLGEVKNGVGKGYVTDHLGSVLNSETAGAARVFGLFGEVGASVSVSPTSSPVSYGYAGYDYDSTSQQYLVGPRTLNPTTGRWSQQDSVDYGGGENFYGYGKNSPLKYVDHTGKGPFLAGVCLAGVGVAAVIGSVSAAIEAVTREAGPISNRIAEIDQELKEEGCPNADELKEERARLMAQLNRARLVQAGRFAAGGSALAVIAYYCYGALIAPTP